MTLALPALPHLYRIPDLKLDVLIVNADHFCSEFDSDRHFVFLPKSLIDELKQKTGFAHTFS